MTHDDRAGRQGRRTPLLLVAAVVAAVAGVAAFGLAGHVRPSEAEAPTPPSTVTGTGPSRATSVPRATAPPPTGVLPRHQPGTPEAPSGVLRGRTGDVLGPADGLLPPGATVFDAGLPGVARLDAALLDALLRASTDARQEGVRIYVDSGWRSPRYQEQLFRQAVSDYGSAAAAARWVATTATSPHVSGDAVDIGHADATAWLSEHGAGYGLCQIYRNEPWHYELRPDAIDRGCPAMYDDPTRDPRMAQ